MTDDSTVPVVEVKNVVKSFKIPLEGSSGLKQKLINQLKGRKGYRTFKPLNDVSFTVNKGDFFGIVGKNGSGKSTLLKTLAGIYSPQSGSISVHGSLVPFIELGVGFNPELTGRENIYLNGALLGFSRKEITLLYNDIVAFAELGDFMDERLKNYSSGMQVRLAFSIAIKAEGDILLLDEVLAVGDAAFQQKCFDYFAELKRDKKTIIIVTHDMAAIKRFCNKALILKDGKIEKIGSPGSIADVYTEDNIEQMNQQDNKSEVKSTFGLNIKVEGNKKRFKADEAITLNTSYKPIRGDRHYLNVSFVYNGFVIADKNTKYDDDLNDQSATTELSFSQNLKNFNSGKYDVYLSLHRFEDDRLMVHIPRAATFLIEGNNPSLDGPLKLDGKWEQVK